MRTYEVTVKVLSPLHVGNSEGQLSALSYFQSDQMVFLSDEKKWARILAEGQSVDLFVSQVEGGIQSLDRILSNLSRFKPHVAAKLQKKGILRAIPKKPVGMNLSGPLHVFVTDPLTNNVYLPGSSLKGAIRTNIIYSLIHFHPESFAKVKHAALSSKNKDAKTVGVELDDLLRSKLTGKNVPPRSQRGPGTDWLSAFRLSDLHPSKNNVTEVREVRVISIIDGKGYRWGARGLRMYVETIRPGTTLHGRLIIDETALRLLKLHTDEYPSFDLQDWVRVIEEKSKTLISEEKELLSRAGLGSLVDALERIEREGANLRLGWGATLLGTTPAVLHFTKEERLRLRQHYFPKRSNPLFPYSRKVIVEGNLPIDTFGWVKITVEKRGGKD